METAKIRRLLGADHLLYPIAPRGLSPGLTQPKGWEADEPPTTSG
jgi:hypothetical protein